MEEPTAQNTRVIIFAYPDKRIPVELADWVWSRYRSDGHPHENVLTLAIDGLIRARNTAVKQYVLGAPDRFKWFLFIDKDVRPCMASDEIYGLTTDIRACRVATKNSTAWAKSNSFHTPMYLARREVFEKMTPPWFMHVHSNDGTELQACECEFFRRKALKLGITISHTGYAGHDMDGTWK